MTVDWYGDRVVLKVADATDDALRLIAERIAAGARLRIVENDQVDTGFMLNTVYVVSRDGGEQYDAAAINGAQALAAAGKSPDSAELGEPAQFTNAAQRAIVAAGAEYAIYQELQHSFLYAAAAAVAGDVGGELKTAAKAAGL